ncbi:MAG: hypothetical protein GX220_05840 [Treponema sp.]|nr:hypothetical protein [Treponema sp.]
MKKNIFLLTALIILFLLFTSCKPIIITDPKLVPPKNFTEVKITDYSISFSWDTVEVASFYNIAFSSNDEIYISLIEQCESATNFELKSLLPNTKYYFKVRSHISSEIYSDYSNVVSFTTLPTNPDQLLFPPKSIYVMCDANDCTKINLSWEETENTTKYEIYYMHDFDIGYKVLTTVADTNYVHTGLDVGKIYNYYIISKNDVGHFSKKSEIVSCGTWFKNTSINNAIDVSDGSSYAFEFSNLSNVQWIKFNTGLSTEVKFTAKQNIESSVLSFTLCKKDSDDTMTFLKTVYAVSEKDIIFSELTTDSEYYISIDLVFGETSNASNQTNVYTIKKNS